MFVGWLTPLVALAGLWLLASRPQRGLAALLGRGSARPVPPGAGRQPSRVRDALAPRPGARCDPGPGAPDADRLPRDRRSRGVRHRGALTRLVSNRHEPLSPLAAVRRGRRARGRPARAGVRRRGGGRPELRVCGDPGRRPPARAPGVPPGRPLRERLPRLCAPEPEGAAAGLLHPRSSRRRPAREAAARALVRARDDPTGPRSALRHRPPRPVRAERLLRARTARSGRSRGSARSGWRLLARDGPIATFSR